MTLLIHTIESNVVGHLNELNVLIGHLLHQFKCIIVKEGDLRLRRKRLMVKEREQELAKYKLDLLDALDKRVVKSAADIAYLSHLQSAICRILTPTAHPCMLDIT